MSINQEALNRALTGLPDDHDHFLKICVWHHPYGNPPDECRIKDDQVMKDLANNGFRVVLHGHAHREMSLIIPYDREAFGCKMEVIAAGTFGARANPKEGRYPYVYHLIEIRGAKAKVNSRTRNMPLGVWDPCGKYKAKGLDSNVLLQPFYEFDL
ncbi:MAG: hypothetical protein FJY85_25905 [Deltaproteobacteria bacterium]|nr:hypothetical protein [Deltaproteobacteria bacterium]